MSHVTAAALAQQFTRVRAELPQGIECPAHRGRAHGRLVAEQPVLEGRLVERRLFDPDLLQRQFQFLRDEHGKRAERPLSQLRRSRNDGHRPVRVERQISVDHVVVDHKRFRRSAKLGARRFQRQVESDDQASCGTTRTLQKFASGNLHLHDRASLIVAAAVCIAARIRVYVPHRHTLVMAASMSASLGSGFRSRSPFAAMIMPDWQ